MVLFHTCAGPIVSPIDVKAAMNNRDSLSKTIYSRMFDWLVEKINTSIGQDPHAASLIGVLDIYGTQAIPIPCYSSAQRALCCTVFANTVTVHAVEYRLIYALAHASLNCYPDTLCRRF